jgi:hypothetical protein
MAGKGVGKHSPVLSVDNLTSLVDIRDQKLRHLNFEETKNKKK